MFSGLKSLLHSLFPGSARLSPDTPRISLEEFILQELFPGARKIKDICVIDILRNPNHATANLYLTNRPLGLPDIAQEYANTIKSQAKHLLLDHSIISLENVPYEIRGLIAKQSPKIRDVFNQQDQINLFNELGLSGLFTYSDIMSVLDHPWKKTPIQEAQDLIYELNTQGYFSGTAHPSDDSILGHIARSVYKKIKGELLKGAIYADIQRELGISLNSHQLQKLFETNGNVSEQPPLAITESRAIKNMLVIHDYCEREGLSLEIKQSLINRFYRTTDISKALQDLTQQPDKKSTGIQSKVAPSPLPNTEELSKLQILLNREIPEGHRLRQSSDWPKVERWLTNVCAGNFDLIKKVIDQNPQIIDPKEFVARVRDLRKYSDPEISPGTEQLEQKAKLPSDQDKLKNKFTIVTALNVNERSQFELWYKKHIKGTTSEEIVSRLLERLKSGKGDRKPLRTSPPIFEIRSYGLGGIRIYYALDDDKIVLLNGGTKSGKKQQGDIDLALSIYKHYLQNKN